MVCCNNVSEELTQLRS